MGKDVHKFWKVVGKEACFVAVKMIPIAGRAIEILQNIEKSYDRLSIKKTLKAHTEAINSIQKMVSDLCSLNQQQVWLTNLKDALAVIDSLKNKDYSSSSFWYNAWA